MFPVETLPLPELMIVVLVLLLVLFAVFVLTSWVRNLNAYGALAGVLNERVLALGIIQTILMRIHYQDILNELLKEGWREKLIPTPHGE